MSRKMLEVLREIGKQTEFYASPDGSRALVLPHGGRILGLFAPGSDENFFWTNSALEDASRAKELFASQTWQNSGGDRTFVSPEVDLFYPNFPDVSVYTWPFQVDPGSYEIENEGGTIRLANTFSLTMTRAKSSIDLKLTKSLGPAQNPLRYERKLSLEGVEYAGYTLTTTLSILGETKARAGIWNLIQLPHRGDLLIPTYSRAEPTALIGKAREEDVVITDNLVHYKMRDAGAQKIGIRAAVSTGRAGYVYRTGGKWAVVIRNFNINPSGEYIDVPMDDTADLGYVAQACNVDTEDLGQFSELEYHAPAIGYGTGKNYSEDVSQVWAFRGSFAAVKSIVEYMLGRPEEYSA